MKRIDQLLVGLVLVAVSLTAGQDNPATAAGQAPAAIVDPARYVNTFIGTGAQARDDGVPYTFGNTYPGAVAPFGMLQWSPDTIEGRPPGGSYDPGRDDIDGFSLTRMSGAGCEQYLNMPFLPFTGSTAPATTKLVRSTESASPGTYAVTTNSGVRTELTTTTRSGIGRFTYPEGQTASLSINAAGGEVVRGASVQLGSNTISGYADAGPFCGIGNWTYRVHFHAVFDRPFKTATTVNNGSKAVVSFDTTTSRTVVAKVAVSYVGVDGAKANITAETASKDFDTVRTDTRAAWNQLLGRISVTGGTPDQLAIFYTALYHSLLHPNVFSDADGRYRGFDDQIHTAPSGHVQHANFSGWDVFRSQAPLLALIAPEYAADIAQSAVNQAAQPATTIAGPSRTAAAASWSATRSRSSSPRSTPSESPDSTRPTVSPARWPEPGTPGSGSGSRRMTPSATCRTTSNRRCCRSGSEAHR